jgi:hypothetical protein
MEHIPDSKARNQMLSEWTRFKADAAAAQVTQARAHASAVRAFCDSVSRLSKRLDVLELRHADAKRRKAKERKAREAKEIQDKLDAIPASYGELTIHPPSHPEDKEQLGAINMALAKMIQITKEICLRIC